MILKIIENIFHEMIIDPVKYIYGIFQTMAYIYLCFFFVSSFFRDKKRNSSKKIIAYICIIIMQYFISVILFDEVVIKILLSSVIMFMFLKYALDATVKEIILWYLMFLALNLATEYLVLEIYKKMFPQTAVALLSDGIAGSMLGILSQIILFLCLIVLRKMFGSKFDCRDINISDKDWVKFLLFPTFTVICISIILVSFDTVQSNEQGQALLVISMGLCLMNVNVFSLLIDVIEKERRIANSKMEEEKAKNQAETNQVILDKYESQKKSIHEFKNHILCISGLARRGKNDELVQYIDRVEHEYTDVEDIFDTNNIYINTVINQKYSEARKKGIVFIFKANDLAICPLIEPDAVSLISNLINNAFEACRECDNKLVKVKIICENNRFLISVSNTYKDAPKIVDDKYLTSKSDMEKHGIGIENIKTIINKYNGIYVIDIKKLFSFIIEIPLKMGD